MLKNVSAPGLWLMLVRYASVEAQADGDISGEGDQRPATGVVASARSQKCSRFRPLATHTSSMASVTCVSAMYTGPLIGALPMADVHAERAFSSACRSSSWSIDEKCR